MAYSYARGRGRARAGDCATVRRSIHSRGRLYCGGSPGWHNTSHDSSAQGSQVGGDDITCYAGIGSRVR
jgi:hypothetical protein